MEAIQDLNALLGGIACVEHDYEYDIYEAPDMAPNRWQVRGYKCRKCGLGAIEIPELTREHTKQLNARAAQWAQMERTEGYITLLTHMAADRGWSVKRGDPMRGMLYIADITVKIIEHYTGTWSSRHSTNKFKIDVGDYPSKHFPQKKDGTFSYDKIFAAIAERLAQAASDRARREWKIVSYKIGEAARKRINALYPDGFANGKPYFSIDCVVAPDYAGNPVVSYELKLSGLADHQLDQFMGYFADHVRPVTAAATAPAVSVEETAPSPDMWPKEESDVGSLVHENI